MFVFHFVWHWSHWKINLVFNICQVFSALAGVLFQNGFSLKLEGLIFKNTGDDVSWWPLTLFWEDKLSLNFVVTINIFVLHMIRLRPYPMFWNLAWFNFQVSKICHLLISGRLMLERAGG